MEERGARLLGGREEYRFLGAVSRVLLVVEDLLLGEFVGTESPRVGCLLALDLSSPFLARSIKESFGTETSPGG